MKIAGVGAAIGLVVVAGAVWYLNQPDEQAVTATPAEVANEAAPVVAEETEAAEVETGEAEATDLQEQAEAAAEEAATTVGPVQTSRFSRILAFFPTRSRR